MKTDDLIRALVADRAPVRNARSVLFRLFPIAVLVLSVVMAASLGFRPDAQSALGAIAMKLAITVSLAIAALAALPVAASHQEQQGLPPALGVAPLLVLVFVGGDLATLGSTRVWFRLVGDKASHCVVLIPLLSAIPLAALLFTLRSGMPASPTRAGALAGLAAAGVGASFYALNCREDSPLFVACWYTIAVLIVTCAGAMIGSRLLRW